MKTEWRRPLLCDDVKQNVKRPNLRLYDFESRGGGGEEENEKKKHRETIKEDKKFSSVNEHVLVSWGRYSNCHFILLSFFFKLINFFSAPQFF